MRSNIIQLATAPIKEENYITEFGLLDMIVPEIADYIEDANPEQVAGIAEKIFSKDEIFDLDMTKRTVTIKNKKRYFEEKFKLFELRLKNVCEKTSLDYFSNCNHDGSALFGALHWLNKIYNNKREYYICETLDSDFHPPITLDDFMRYSDDGDVFYIGGALFYHN